MCTTNVKHSQNKEEGEEGDVVVPLSLALSQVAIKLGVQSEVSGLQVITVLVHGTQGVCHVCVCIERGRSQCENTTQHAHVLQTGRSEREYMYLTTSTCTSIIER